MNLMKNLLDGGVMLDKQTPVKQRLIRSCLDCGCTRTSIRHKSKEIWHKHLGAYLCHKCYQRVRKRNSKK